MAASMFAPLDLYNNLMKKLPLLLLTNLCIVWSTNSNSIIGKSIKVGYYFVAENDFFIIVI